MNRREILRLILVAPVAAIVIPDLKPLPTTWGKSTILSMGEGYLTDADSWFATEKEDSDHIYIHRGNGRKPFVISREMWEDDLYHKFHKIKWRPGRLV